MGIRFITKQIHAYLDYPVAIALTGLPFLLGLGASNPAAFWLSVIVGIAAFALTILTDHHLGVIRVLPYSFHLLVDGAVGVLFLLSPTLFGFSGIDAMFYWVNAIAVLAVVSLHKTEDEQLMTA